MTKWLIIITLIISLGIFGFLYTRVAHDSGMQAAQADTSAPSANEVPLVHSFKDGVHHYQGQLKLSHSCYAVNAETSGDAQNPKLQHIIISVVDNMAKEGFCAQIPTRYPFEVLLDAPEDTLVSLEINGKEVPVKIYETAWQNPSSGYLTPINKTGI